MLKSRAINVISLLAAGASVYACLLVADVRVLAERSSSIAVAHSQLRSGASQTSKATATETQAERPIAEFVYESVKLNSQDEKIVARSPLDRETFCALLSNYLSLS